MFSEILDTLNPVQREAVEYFGGPLLIIAGAGSGKTRVITHKIAFSVYAKKYFPSEIFAATFTNKAAAEMKLRVENLLKPISKMPFNIGTFHSLCAKILRYDGKHIGVGNNFTILDEDDQLSVIKQAAKTVGISQSYLYNNTEKLTPGRLQKALNDMKINMISTEEADKNAKDERAEAVAKVYGEYQRTLDANNALDFDDLIYKSIVLFRNSPETLARYKNRFRYILVDEYQDTNLQQFELIRILTEGENKICVVGDEDQSIYSWRGADIRNILEFQKKFDNVKIVKLEQNYRSTKNILRAANAVIENNKERIGKNLWTEHEEGSKIYTMKLEDENDEARFIADRIIRYNTMYGVPLANMAVFCRTNGLTRCPETQFNIKGIPYKIIGGIRFYEREEIKDIISYLKLVENPNNDIALRRVINKPKRGFGEKFMSDLSICAADNKTSLFAALVGFYENNVLSRAQSKKAEEFLTCLTEWQKASESKTLTELVDQIIDDTEYIKFLEETKTDVEVAAKKDNIEEFHNAISEYLAQNPQGDFSDFLEKITLVSSQDEIEEDKDKISIMTIHCAKGLEYDVVFIIGLEDPLFPNAYSISPSGSFEEERRLFYVAITRARKKLYLTYTMTRMYKGSRKWFSKSCFLREIPHSLKAYDDEVEFTPPDMKAEAKPAEVKPAQAEDVKSEYPIGARVRHEEYKDGTVVGYKQVVSKISLRVYFDKGYEMTISDLKTLQKIS